MPPNPPAADDTSLAETVRVVLDENPGLVRLHLAGKSALGGLVGQTLKKAPGSDPARIVRLLKAELAHRYPEQFP